eukprot:10524901-Alexandrium_andersonii.AAC.1
MVRYACRIPGCSGGEACRDHAEKHVHYMLLQALFCKKVIIPSLSRWWKCAPLCRQVLLGCALHS